MIMQCYAVYDKAVGAYLRPVFTRSKGEALRSFMEACNDEKSEFSRHASDYVFFYLAEWDDGTGLFNCVEPQRLVSALECLRELDAPFHEGNRVGNGGAPSSAINKISM